MLRLLRPWLMLAPVLAAGLVLAQPPPPPPVAASPVEPVEAPAVEAEPPADEAAAAEEAGTAEAAEDTNGGTAITVDEDKAKRAGYADSSGNLQNMEETGGLRISLRSGPLRAKRGFTPLEVTLHNTEAVPRTVRLSFQGYGQGSPTTGREVELGPRQRLVAYLLIPAPVQSGALSVQGPGMTPRTMGVYLDESSAVAALVLGSSKAFEASTGLARAEDSSQPVVNARFLSAQDAPRELAAYAGYPAVLVTEEVASVPSDVWAALENYAAVGGALVISKPPRDLRQRLPLLDAEPERQAWNAYGFGSVYLCESGAEDCGRAVVSVNEEGKLPVAPIGPAQRWEENRFALRGGELPLLPNALVPVGRFLVLIFLFSLVVGPGGLMLARRKGPLALLIGVPAVALVTCLIIIADSVLGDGFITHASRYSYTLLDRPRDRAVTAGVAGYYANLASDKVTLPSNSVLLAPDDLEEWPVDVVWTGGGMEAEGFLPSRTYVEWGELAVVPTRARLVLRKEGEGWKVQNALGAPLEAGYVQLGSKQYALPALADGAEALATEVHDESSSNEERVQRFISTSGGLLHRSNSVSAGFRLPLKDRGFVARLGGLGFGPLAVLPVQLHEGTHYVRGQVDAP